LAATPRLRPIRKRDQQPIRGPFWSARCHSHGRSPKGYLPYHVDLAALKSSVRDAIELRQNDRTTVDFVLEVGNVVESIVDSGATPLLGSADARIGMTLDERRFSELPVMRGKVFFPGRLSPGVASPGNTGRSAG
jgi:hypothetical protein